MQMPLKSAKVTYPYGVRDNRYGKGYHTGIDMANTEAVVYACVAGTIIESQYASGKGADPSGWGNYIILRTENGKYDIIHAHLASIKTMRGEKVTEGQILGIMGSTGNSTGPHLHFEVREVPWVNKNDIDPAAFLGIENATGPIIVKKGGSNVLKHAILLNTTEDFWAASEIARKLGAPMFLRLSDKTAPVEARRAEHLIVVGGLSTGHPNETLLSGVDKFATAAEVKKYFGKM